MSKHDGYCTSGVQGSAEPWGCSCKAPGLGSCAAACIQTEPFLLPRLLHVCTANPRASWRRVPDQADQGPLSYIIKQGWWYYQIVSAATPFFTHRSVSCHDFLSARLWGTRECQPSSHIHILRKPCLRNGKGPAHPGGVVLACGQVDCNSLLNFFVRFLQCHWKNIFSTKPLSFVLNLRVLLLVL